MKKLILIIMLGVALLTPNILVNARDGVVIETTTDITFNEILEQQIPSNQVALYANIIDAVNFIQEYNEDNFSRVGYTEVFSRLIMNGSPLNDSYFHFYFRKDYNEIDNTSSYSCYVRLNLEPIDDINYYINNVILDISLVLDQESNILDYQTYSSINNFVGLQTYGYNQFYFKRGYTRFRNTLNNVDISDIVKFYRTGYQEYYLNSDIPDYDKIFNDGVQAGYDKALQEGNVFTDFLQIVREIFKAFSVVLDIKLLQIGAVDISLGSILGVPLALGVLWFIIGWFRS